MPGSLVSARPPEHQATDTGNLNLEELIEQARVAGYAEGVTSVTAEQERLRSKAIEDAARQLLQASQAALEDRTAIVNSAVADAIELALDVVRTILGRELLLAENPTRDALEQALRLAPDGDNFVVRVPPGSDLDVSHLLALTHGAPISIKEDPSIRNGDCVVEVAACRIDRQIENALARVRAELERLVCQSIPEPSP